MSPPLQLKPPLFKTCSVWLPISAPPLIVSEVGVVMPLPFKFNVPPEMTSALVIVKASVILTTPPLTVRFPAPPTLLLPLKVKVPALRFSVPPTAVVNVPVSVPPPDS